jgi:hypothetical protein
MSTKVEPLRALPLAKDPKYVPMLIDTETIIQEDAFISLF